MQIILTNTYIIIFNLPNILKEICKIHYIIRSLSTMKIDAADVNKENDHTTDECNHFCKYANCGEKEMTVKQNISFSEATKSVEAYMGAKATHRL